MVPRIDRLLRAARRALVATDFDGTLCPLAEHPNEVRLHPAMLALMRSLLESPRITLAVISGRSLRDLEARIPLPVVLAGNHGLEICGGGLEFQHSAATRFRDRLAEAEHHLREAARGWPGAWVEDKGLTFTLHYRSVSLGQAELLLAARDALAASNHQLLLRQGRETLDILPNVMWNKGSALRYIQRRLGPFDACVCLGDDVTDEDMFRANRGHINIRVGESSHTNAAYRVTGPVEVLTLLRQIASLRPP